MVDTIKWADIKKDPKLKTIFVLYCKKEFALEMVMFIDLRLQRGSNFEDLYNKYISDSSKWQVNIGAPTKKGLDKLAEELTESKSRNWADMLSLMQEAQKEVCAVLESDTMKRFVRSKEYKKYMEEDE